MVEIMFAIRETGKCERRKAKTSDEFEPCEVPVMFDWHEWEYRVGTKKV